MDGTFKVLPPLFKQLYTIHGKYIDQYYPLIFCLLPSKKETTYTRMLEIIQNKAEENNLTFSPKKVTLDFEKAVISSVSSVFPNAKIQGCLFHYSQCIWRKVQQLGLTQAYKNDAGVRKWIRRAAALPLLPEENVHDAFINIMESAPDVIAAEPFHDYMVETWLDDSEAQFPPYVFVIHLFFYSLCSS